MNLKENNFFIGSHPPLPKCCKTIVNIPNAYVRVCLLVSNVERGGRGGYLSPGERGEFTPKEKRLVVFMYQQLVSIKKCEKKLFLKQDVKPKEMKPSIVSQHCVVLKFVCDLFDADYVGYTTLHLHQRIAEHKYSAIGR